MIDSVELSEELNDKLTLKSRYLERVFLDFILLLLMMINLQELSYSTTSAPYRVCTVVNVSDIMIKKLSVIYVLVRVRACVCSTQTHIHSHTYVCVCFSSAHTTRLNRNICWQLCTLIERRAMFMPCYEMERRAPATIGGTIRMGYGVYKQSRAERTESREVKTN